MGLGRWWDRPRPRGSSVVVVEHLGRRAHGQRVRVAGQRHGMNAQVLADPAGRLIGSSPALRGSTHDLTVPAPTGFSLPTPKRTSRAGPIRPTESRVFRSACRTAAGGKNSRQDSRRSTAPTPSSAPWANAPSPPSNLAASAPPPMVNYPRVTNRTSAVFALHLNGG